MGDSPRNVLGFRQPSSKAIEDQISAQVIVVLSAYNGARHIAEQIESIRAQSFADWKLILRDDGSTDDTVRIVNALSARDERIELFTDVLGNIGPWASFGELLTIAHARGADYVFLADQDDVWLPDKMEKQLSLLRSIENNPGLIHSDLKIVGEDLDEIHPSFVEFQRSSYDASDPLRTLLIHNAVVGCTIVVNRALLDFALPIPTDAWHDWWLALSAAAAGTIKSTRDATVLYRQHSHNVVGGAIPPRRNFLGSLATRPIAFTRQSLRAFNDGLKHATELRARMQLRGADASRLKRVEEYCRAFESNGVSRRLRAYRASHARPQRTTSRMIMFGIVAAFPAMRALAAK
jgi:glycosyltransferase involved in cell wall biosynthesis